MAQASWIAVGGANLASHFERIAARAMRQVLVEPARRRQADKRGGGVAWVTFDEAIDSVVSAAGTTADDLLALNQVLDDLRRIDPRQATPETTSPLMILGQ